MGTSMQCPGASHHLQTSAAHLLPMTPICLKVKAKILPRALTSHLHDLAQYCLTCYCPLTHSSRHLAFLICLRPARYTPAPGPLHWLLTQPSVIFSQIPRWLSSLSPSRPHSSYGLSEAYTVRLCDEATPSHPTSPKPLTLLCSFFHSIATF